MGFDRRDFLKYFTAGAIVAPVVGGAADEQHMVQLVTAPKIAAAPLPELVPADVYGYLLNRRNLEVTLLIRDRDNGERMRLQCSAFVSRVVGEVRNVPVRADPAWANCRPAIVACQTIDFTATGPMFQVKAGR